MEGIALLVVFVLAAFLAVELVRDVDPGQNPALAFGTNAIQAVVLVGAILVAGTADSWPARGLALVVVAVASGALVAGWLLTVRAATDGVAVGGVTLDVADDHEALDGGGI